MGSRGAASGTGKHTYGSEYKRRDRLSGGNRGSYLGPREWKDTVDYAPYKYGQITRKEAGTIYKAIKNGEITAKPETTKTLYGATDAYIRYADSRYSQDRLYYDLVYSATRHLLNGRTKEAQKDLKWWEDRNIDAATKKSPWYKYKK